MQTKSKQALQKELEALKAEKENLLSLKNDNPDFTEEQQRRLVEVTEKVVDLEEQIIKAPEEKPKPKEKPSENAPEQKPRGYVPEPGTENLVHLNITKGSRFDENTGKEISKPYKQTLTYGEFVNFKKNADQLGFRYEVLYNPFNI